MAAPGACLSYAPGLPKVRFPPKAEIQTQALLAPDRRTDERSATGPASLDRQHHPRSPNHFGVR